MKSMELSQEFLSELGELSKKHGLKVSPAGWTSTETIECLHMIGEGGMYVTDSERDGNNIQLITFQAVEKAK